MSELRTDLHKVKTQLKKTPILITNNGKPDFGICDLETFEIAVQIKNLKDLLQHRLKNKNKSENVAAVFSRLNKKYNE
ncbi:MAG: hypothetical protein HQM15_05860 [Deltaproteobacteria bacterium]|nr:hypothetical protein [Deltaproteobacteria bacterium]